MIILLFRLIDVVINFISLAIVARIILSWIPQAQRSQIYAGLWNITEPLLHPIRRIIPPIGGVLDLSPMLLLLLLQLAKGGLWWLLLSLY